MNMCMVPPKGKNEKVEKEVNKILKKDMKNKKVKGMDKEVLILKHRVYDVYMQIKKVEEKLKGML